MPKQKYTRDADGYFQTKVWDGTYTQTGTKHRITLRSKKSSADLEKQVIAVSQKVKERSLTVSSSVTVSAYADQWLKTKAVFQRKTQLIYQNIVDYYVKPGIGAIRISELTKTHLQGLISSSSDHPRTCQLIRQTVLQVASSAVDDRYLPEVVLKQLSSVSMPEYRAAERRVLTKEEKDAIRTADLTDMQRCFIYLIYGLGLRRGEALGMTAHDIDFKAATARVCRSVEFIDNSSALKVPKSRNGLRDVPVPSFLIDFLRTYLPTLKTDYLVHKKDGGIMTQSAFRRMWEQILKKLNEAAAGKKNVTVIHGLTPHVFRHTYCTELCYQVPTVSTKKIARLLGDTEAMVLKVYSHIMEEKEDTTKAISAAIVL